MNLRLLMTNRAFGPTPRRLALLCLPLALAACGLTRPPAVADAPIPTQWNAPLPKATAAAMRPDCVPTKLALGCPAWGFQNS